MPEKNSTVTQAQWVTVVKLGISLVLAAAVLTAGFYSLHAQHVSDYRSSTLTAIEILVQAERTRGQSYHQRLENHARSLIKLRNVLSAVLLDKHGEVVFEVGKPLDDRLIDNIHQKKLSEIQDDVLTYIKPISSSPGDVFIVRIDLKEESIHNFKFFLLCGAVFIIFCFVALHLKTSFLKHIATPLLTLTDKISNNLDGEHVEAIHVDDAELFQELVEKINQLIRHMESRATQQSKNLNDSITELTESLESIEIKNATLDIERKQSLHNNKSKTALLQRINNDIVATTKVMIQKCEAIKSVQHSDDIQKHTQSMSLLASTLLSMAKDIDECCQLEAPDAHTEHKAIDIVHSIETALKSVADKGGDDNISFRSTFDIAMPQAVLAPKLKFQYTIESMLVAVSSFCQSTLIIAETNLISKAEETLELAITVTTDGETPEALAQWFNKRSAVQGLASNLEMQSATKLFVIEGLAKSMGGVVQPYIDEERHGISLKIKLEYIADNHTPQTRTSRCAHIHAAIYTDDTHGKFEILSKLNLLQVRTRQSESLSDLLITTKQLMEKQQQNERFSPVVVIEVLKLQPHIDELMLDQALSSISKELGVPVLILCSKHLEYALDRFRKNPALKLEILTLPLVTSALEAKLLQQASLFEGTTKSISSAIGEKEEPARILVVDDNPSNIKITKAMLNNYRVIVDSALSGKEALIQFGQHDYQLIFMDIELPDMNGYQITQQIRAQESQERRTPIVAVTAHNVATEKQRFLLADMDDAIAKPMSDAAMTIVLDRWILDCTKHSTRSKLAQLNGKDNTSPPPVDDTSTQNASHATAHLTPVNLTQCVELAKQNSALAQELFTLLIESLPETKRQANQHFQDGDFEALYHCVHKLYGSCCYSGVPTLRNISEALDRQLSTNTHEKLEDNIEKLNEAIDELLLWVSDHDIDVLFE